MKPMLLSRYKGDCVFPIWAERKINGVRCLIHVDHRGARAYSREEKPLAVAQGWADEIARLGVQGVFDGELAHHGGLNDTISHVKSRDPRGLTLYLFDALDIFEALIGRSDLPIEARRERLQELRGARRIEIVQPYLLHDANELQAHFSAAIGNGWEGLCLKEPGSVYVPNARWRAWQKLKPEAVE